MCTFQIAQHNMLKLDVENLRKMCLQLENFFIVFYSFVLNFFLKRYQYNVSVRFFMPATILFYEKSLLWTF